MSLAESLLLNAQGPAEHGDSFRLMAEQALNTSEALQGTGDLRVFRSLMLLPDSQRLPIKRPGFRELPLPVSQFRQPVEIGRHRRMPGAQASLVNSYNPPQAGGRLVVAALLQRDIHQPFQGWSQIRVLAAKIPLLNG